MSLTHKKDCTRAILFMYYYVHFHCLHIFVKGNISPIICFFVTLRPQERTLKTMKRIFVTIIAAAAMFTSCSSFVAIERGEHQRSDSALIEYIRSEEIPLSHNNSVKMLDNAQEKFDSLFSDIRRAKHHIHLEYFNFRNDSINKVLIELLASKAKEGVEVRAMFDAFGNMSNDSPLKKKDLEAIRAQGIEIVKFDPIVFPWVNHSISRDHRKIVVIDGEKGYIGGINVADYYLQGLEGIGNWRDIHSRVEGAAVNDLQRIFLDMWKKETGEEITGEVYFPVHTAVEGATVAVVDRWPGKTPKRMRHTYANAINAAKESIAMINPYFIPMPIVRKAIEKALKDGVEVTIVLSEKGDIPMVPDGVWRVGYQLMKQGAKVYMYTGGFNHAKVMSIDGQFCTVGSANLNSRSLNYDYEANLFIFGSEDTEELNMLIEADKARSFLLTKEKYKARSWWRRFCGWLVTVATPIM